jgi:DNA invertase Pin-like site-specific DNA recombinase
MHHMTKLAYSYLRFSSPEQAKGDSERRQLAKFDAYCKRKGLTPARDSFADRGRSGYKAEHLGDTGDLARFLRLVKDGAIAKGSTLVVENLDRLGRQEVEEAFAVFSGILGAGIRIVTLADGEGEREYVKGMGTIPLIMSILEMARAHGESQRKSELVSAAFANKQSLARSAFKPMGRTCPMWLRLKPNWRSREQDGSAYEVIPEHAEVVQRIFRLAVDEYGKGRIAQKLNADGVPSFKSDMEKLRARGLAGWGSSSVDKVLKNRAVFGEFQPMTSRGAPKGKKVNAGDAIPGYFPSVVSVETFHEAQAAIDGRRTSKATKQSATFNLWQGIGKCEKCGSNLHLVNKGAPPKGATYLRCANTRKGVCKSKAVRLDEADAVFRGMLIRLDALSLVKDSSAGLDKSLRALEGQLSDARKRLASLEQRLAEAPESEAIGRLLVRAEDEVKAHEKERRTLKAQQAAEDGISWDEFFRRLDLASYEGRAKANALMKRQGVLVIIGPSGYAVTQDGKTLFGMDFRDGEAGFLMPSFGRKLMQFFPVNEIPRLDAEEEAAAAREDEGTPAGEY